MTYHTKEDEERLFKNTRKIAKRTEQMLDETEKPPSYYLFSFQIHTKPAATACEKFFEVNAKLEKDKVVFEFKIDDETQKELMKMFEERFKLINHD